MSSETRFSWGASLPVLESARLALRPLGDEDVPALFGIFGDTEVTRFWSWPAFTDIAAARALLDDIRRHFAARTLFQWGIELRATGEIIGTCTLFHIDEAHRRGEIGCAIARAHWGYGYASDALTTLLRFAFEQLDLHRIEADPDPQNVASIRLIERQGFKREGYLRERYFLNGEPQAALAYGLLRREWTPAVD
ncbi:MAG: GNAT family protein [Vicinamibacterales bacterium]